MAGQRRIAGHFYPDFHPGWGAFAEELFFYTSRYHVVTESFLRHLAERPDFTMTGYRAERMTEAQRAVMAAILCQAPTRETAQAVISLIEAVLEGEAGVPAALDNRFSLPRQPRSASLPNGHARRRDMLDANALEPLLSMAERLHMAVAVHDHHVEVDMQVLASHLDSENPAIRSNLQQCILDLHNAGYRLRNHPHLTHEEARQIGDEGAV